MGVWGTRLGYVAREAGMKLAAPGIGDRWC
jgi:hypothetical protein